MKKIMIALLMTLLSSPVWSQQPFTPQQPVGELAPDQIAAIQRIGKSVLGAKQSYSAPAALSAISAELAALKGSIVISQSVAQEATLKLTPSSPASQASAENDQKTRFEKKKQELDSHLQSIRALHQALDEHAAGNNDGKERTMERGASAKLTELEQDLAEAQAAPDTERWTRLGALAQKLTPQSLSAISKTVESQPVEITTWRIRLLLLSAIYKFVPSVVRSIGVLKDAAVLNYLKIQLGVSANIDVFICSHRDADHMRGIKKIHKKFPIKHVWDSGVVGTTPTSSEYLEYMEIRRRVGFTEVEHKTMYDHGNTRLRIFNSKNDELADNANAQSLVIKVVHRDSETDTDHGSVLLTGDTDAVTWQNIRTRYDDSSLSCSILLASHHGSITYFDDPSDTAHYYTSHIKAKSPAMTIISVGDNAHGHPDKKSIEFYEKHSSGASNGDKVYRTDKNGNILLTLKDGGGWSIQKEK